jgi:carbon-monoxide dehydrogenase small subunit
VSYLGGRRLELRTTLNGREIELEIRMHDTLAEVLREDLGLTGTKVSCDEQICGTCTVLVDDLPVSSCTLLAAEVAGRSVRTIEGVGASPVDLHPMQVAFMEANAFQCGYCTPGMIMAAISLIETDPTPTRDEVVEWLSGNICRCTGYASIIDAVLAGAAACRA